MKLFALSQHEKLLEKKENTMTQKLMDSDVVAWFKLQSGKYQSHINQVLREHMKEHVIADLADQK